LAFERKSYSKVDSEDQQQQNGNNSAGNTKGFGHEIDFSTLRAAMDINFQYNQSLSSSPLGFRE